MPSETGYAGSGVGSGGLLAAKLGASKSILSDFYVPLLSVRPPARPPAAFMGGLCLPDSARPMAVDNPEGLGSLHHRALACRAHNTSVKANGACGIMLT